jgi:small-conductance mechanosensitive channel
MNGLFAATVTDTVTGWREAFVTSFQNAFAEIIHFAPNAIAMVVVLVLGYIISRTLGRVVIAVSERLGLQTAAERSGLAASMKQVGIIRGVPAIMGLIMFWSSMSLFLMAAFNVMELPAVSAAMQPVFEYIPKLLVATVLVVVGLLLASFVRGVIATSADRVGISFAEYLATGVYYVLVLIIGFSALHQLGIELELLNRLVLIAFSSLAVGFALAFGLGGREVMGGILAGYYLRQRIHAGDEVSVAGMDGTVRDVGPVATIIETHEDGLMNRHSVPNTKMLNEAVR